MHHSSAAHYNIFMSNLKVISLFSGIGAYEKALEQLKIPFTLINFCENDPQASRCYELIHRAGKDQNLKDVCGIDPEELPEFDLLTFSPPCQDISRVGYHAGARKGTRTGLMWKVIDIVAIKKPKYLVMENVRTLVGKYQATWDAYVAEIQKNGYECSYKVLNAVDYGVPQKRERLFLVGVRSDMGHGFEMPKKKGLRKHLRDYLEGEAKQVDRNVAKTVRVGGRKSPQGNRHNWDGYIVDGKYHVLTAKECLLLMGFSSLDYDLMKAARVSDSKIASLAGNSVVVDVLVCIFRNLLKSGCGSTEQRL